MYLEWMKKIIPIPIIIQFTIILLAVFITNQLKIIFILVFVISLLFFGGILSLIFLLLRNSQSRQINFLLIMWDVFFIATLFYLFFDPYFSLIVLIIICTIRNIFLLLSKFFNIKGINNGA